jgi:hypothetical protein
MTTALRELFAVFDVDTAKAATKVKALDKEVSHAKGTFALLAKSALGAFAVHSVKEFLEGQIELGSQINDTADKLGVGTDELQKFQFAAGLTGVGAEEAAKALGFLNKNMGEALGGGAEQAKTFAELGVSIKDGAGNVRELGDVIPELADAFGKMGSQQERTATAMKLFGKSGAALLPMLNGGSEEMKKLNAQFDALGLGIDEDFIKKADEAGDQIDILKLGLRSLKTRIAVEVLPGLTEFAKKLQGWVGWGIKVTRETNIVKYAWMSLGLAGAVAGAKAAKGWAEVLGVLPKGSGFWRTVLGLGEIGLVIAGVALLALAFEDLYTMVNGGESVIGDFLTETFGISYTNQLVNQLKGSFEQVDKAIADLGPQVKELGKGLITIAVSALPYMIAGFIDLVKLMIAGVIQVQAFAEALGKIASLDFSGAKDVLKGASAKISGPRGIFERSAVLDTINAPSVPKGQVRQPTSMERNVDASGDTTININVEGGNTNAQTAKAVGDATSKVADEKRAALAALITGAEDE